MAGSHHREDDPTILYHHHRCHFPVSQAKPPKDQTPHQYIRVPTFPDDGCQEKEQPTHVVETRGEVLLSAWAVLLHKYVGSEVVSFAAFCSPDSPNERKSTDTLALGEDRSNGDIGSHGYGGSIVRYRVSENARLRDICKVSKEPCMAGDLSRGRPVNTATDFSGRLNVMSCGQQDEKEEKEKLSIVQSGSHHWSNNDCVRSSLFLYHSILIMCAIENETLFNRSEIQSASSCALQWLDLLLDA